MKMIADPITSPGDIMHSTDTTWTDIDVSAHVGADAGDVAGVYLLVTNFSDANDGTTNAFGLRKNGSTDDTTVRHRLEVFTQTYYAIGVDSSDIFECYANDASDYEIFLLGYWTNDEAEFLTNAQDVTPGSSSTWTSTDLSSYFTGTVLAACLHTASGYSGDSTAGAQDASGPDRYSTCPDYEGWGSVVACTSEECEVYVGSTDIKVLCVGAITDGFTKFSETSHNFSAADTYEDIDLSSDIPAGGVACLFQHHDGSGQDTGRPNFASRADGASWEQYDDLERCGSYMISQINTTTRVVEQKTGNDAKNSYFVGYFTEVSGGGAVPVAAIAHHHRMLQGVV